MGMIWAGMVLFACALFVWAAGAGDGGARMGALLENPVGAFMVVVLLLALFIGSAKMKG